MVSGLCIRSEIKRAPDTSPEYEGETNTIIYFKNFSGNGNEYEEKWNKSTLYLFIVVI